MTNSRADETLAAAEEFSRTYMKAVEMLMRSAGDVVRLGFEANPVVEALSGFRNRRSCRIPQPCWVPQSLGEVRSVVCPGGSAALRIRVTNCRPEKSTVTAAFGSADVHGDVSPESATLGPMERAVFDARLALPDDGCVGRRFETLVWIRGCNAHFLRWTVEAGESSHGSCHEIEVEDCPDYVHHWYDHFYCDRPCFDEGHGNRGS